MPAERGENFGITVFNLRTVHINISSKATSLLCYANNLFHFVPV